MMECLENPTQEHDAEGNILLDNQGVQDNCPEEHILFILEECALEVFKDFLLDNKQYSLYKSTGETTCIQP